MVHLQFHLPAKIQFPISYGEVLESKEEAVVLPHPSRTVMLFGPPVQPLEARITARLGNATLVLDAILLLAKLSNVPTPRP